MEVTKSAHYRLVVPGEPLPQPRQRHTTTAKGQIVNYTPRNHPVQAYKETIQWAARAAGVQVLTGAVGIQVRFFMPRPKGRKVGLYHTGKPDSDNLVKAVKDALTGIAWADDSQVAHDDIYKIYAEPGTEARTEIYIWPLE